MLAFPGTKINLGLSVKRKRRDGFHELETIFYPLRYSDVLEVVPSDVFDFQISGIAVSGNQNDNLVVKAYERMRSHYNTGCVKIHLHKIVPPGTGLGGGSADAAATLLLMNTVFDLNLETKELEARAAELGSDCPFFINHQPSLATGRGELLQPLPISLKGYFIVVVLPYISISTTEAYRQVKPKEPMHQPSSIIKKAPEFWKDKLINDFEELPIVPEEIHHIKSQLYDQGALYASLSGSGSAVYGIFSQEKNMDEIKKKYRVYTQILD